MNTALIQKYNVPGPRYTSYPTVPYWDKTAPSQEAWENALVQAFREGQAGNGMSLYIHLPFCESLCTYCGCNTRISINHAVEQPYIAALLKEWQMYLERFGERPKIHEIHLGGGTPTFFSPENLRYLLGEILKTADISGTPAFGFEAHPRNTTEAHLQTLYDLGFRRLSLGIQDFDPKVQEIVNRVQSFEQVAEVTQQARTIGYTSINFDLIYGLPLQTRASVEDTIEKVSRLRPERIAFYSYAHVPWVKPGQRKFTEKDLPADAEKRALYEIGKQAFEQLGYVEIGMDHFALPEDELAIAFAEGSLHRNFMGYTAEYTPLLLGLGASSISDAWTAFVQNVKKVEDYYAALEQGEFPFFRGHLLNEEDLILRRHILNLMCHFETDWQEESTQAQALYDSLERLAEMEQDGLLSLAPYQIKVTDLGKAFVRNICMALDARMLREKPNTQIFSQTI